MNAATAAKPFRLTVKAVIRNDQQQCLLVRRSTFNKNFVGCWEWPGGKVDGGEDFAMALLREAREETGLVVEITGLAGVTQFEMPKAQVVLLCMEARIAGGEVRLSEEHDDLVWASLTELQNYKLLPIVGDFMLAYATKKGTTL